jgi:glycosyl transferase, family 25
MKVYVINLDRHPDRLAHMREQLGDIGFERVDAVDGSKNPETTKGLTRFELGCIESHRNAWSLFLTSSDAHACFLEDDVHLWPDFARLAQSEAWIPSDAHSVKLDTYLQKVKLGERRAAFGVRQVARLYTRHESSAAYALSRAGAERYLELTARPILPADYTLFPKNPRRFGLRIYQLAPAVAIQDHLLRAEDGGQTLATTMSGGGSAQARRLPPLGRLSREGARLVAKVSDVGEAIYLRTFLRPETTTVGVG